MDHTKSAIKPALTYGITLGLVLVIYSVLLYILNLSFNKYMSWLSYVIVIITVLIATKSYRDNILKGVMNYNKALGFSMLVIVFGAILTAIYSYLEVTVINPDHIEKALAVAEEHLVQKGGLTDDQIEMALSIQKKMMQPVFILIINLFSYIFIGFIIALITSAFLKKTGDPYLEAMKDIEE